MRWIASANRNSPTPCPRRRSSRARRLIRTAGIASWRGSRRATSSGKVSSEGDSVVRLQKPTTPTSDSTATNTLSMSRLSSWLAWSRNLIESGGYIPKQRTNLYERIVSREDTADLAKQFRHDAGEPGFGVERAVAGCELRGE